MTDLAAALGRALAGAFEACDLSAEYGRVAVSDRPDLADFQCNGALAAAKAARRNPREIAAAVAKGRKIHPGVNALVVPGSGLVKAQAEAEGES